MILKLGKYRHYKGRDYQLLFIAKDSDSLEETVVYQGLYNDPEFGKKPVRTKSLKGFEENVKIDGKTIPRFKYVGE